MRLTILSIGKMKSGPERDLLERYVERANKAGPQLGIHSVLVREWPESRESDCEQRKADEAKKLLGALDNASVLIALDEHGKDLPSQQFADHFQNALAQGTPEIALAIGGPDGHGQAVLARANHTVRFGKMTWPHQLARVLAAEQIYRAITILSGHPYHRA